MSDLENAKVGDVLFVSSSIHRTGHLETVKKITPTGRVVTAHSQYAKDGQRRGCASYGIYYARLATEADLQALNRHRMIRNIQAFRGWADLTDEEIKTISGWIERVRTSKKAPEPTP